MKKIIGIYYNAHFTESSFETGCGGSDTWVIQIAKEFVRKGYHTIVFCQCDTWVITQSGVEYVPLDLFDMRCEYQHFDYFIMTRAFNSDLYYKIVNTGCENIYVQSHDQFIWEHDIYHNRLWYDFDKFPCLKKYIALTNFHKEKIHEYNNIPYDKIAVIGNGLDSDIFNEVDKLAIIEDNNILFTSVYSRGGDILVNHILPRVLKKIPNFNVHLCGYVQDFPNEVYNNPHVKILGMLTKEDYYKEFMKHKVWFLPCVVPEDFGLCACEAAMCDCDIISTFEHGMKDVCFPFVNLSMYHKFKTKDIGSQYHRSQYQLEMTEDEFNKTCQEAADRIIDSIKNYYNPDRIKLRNSFKNFILGTYTWSNVVDKWINLFEKK